MTKYEYLVAFTARGTEGAATGRAFIDLDDRIESREDVMKVEDLIAKQQGLISVTVMHFTLLRIKVVEEES